MPRSRPICWRRRLPWRSKRRARFRDVGRGGGAWLHGIAAKELSHWFRRQAVELRAVRRLAIDLPALDDESIARIESLAELDAQRGLLAAALGEMTAGERHAVELRVVEEMGYAEIARRLDAARLLPACAFTANSPG